MTPPWVGGLGVKAYCYKIVQQLRYHIDHVLKTSAMWLANESVLLITCINII